MSVLFAILLFSILIFVHELGHFAAAKLSGVQVNEFSMFMGPALWKKQIGETLYSVRLIPIGGFCAMEGEEEDTDNPRSFQKAAWWKRLIILVAGAAMNFLMGIVLMFLVYLPAQAVVEPVIASFEEFSTVDGEHGLQVGDRILELDGEKIYVQSDFSLILSLHPGDYHDLVVERDGQKVALTNFLMEKHEVAREVGGNVHGDFRASVNAAYAAGCKNLDAGKTCADHGGGNSGCAVHAASQKHGQIAAAGLGYRKASLAQMLDVFLGCADDDFAAD